ncbi:MAG: efflux RND transporter periplasmic adaptor subunit [Spirochaetia bacterium]|nr:efflux RND transporter periplasmic adaptor subunit [Spirochaetia bacterium]
MHIRRKLKILSILKYILLAAVLWFVGTIVLRLINAPPEIVIRPKPAVIVMYPEYDDIIHSVALTGYIETDTMVTVLPRVSGILEELYVEAGDVVTEGELVALLDTAPLELQMAQAEAAFIAAQSSFKRVEQLYNAKAATKQSYDEAKSQYDLYSSQYELAKIQYDYAAVTSPISGTVMTVHTSAGSLTSPQVPLVTLGDFNDLIVTVRVPEKYYDLFLSRGKSMEIGIKRPDMLEDTSNREVISGVIESISPYISADSKSFSVKCSLRGAVEKLRPGMYVEVEIIINAYRDVLGLPYKALTAGNSLWYIDDNTGTAQAMEFYPELSSDSFFSIPDEFSDRLFIIDGHHVLLEGQKVSYAAPVTKSRDLQNVTTERESGTESDDNNPGELHEVIP